MVELLLVAAGALLFFLASIAAMKAHQIMGAAEAQLSRARATLEELQRGLVEGGLKLERLRLESTGLDTLQAEASGEVRRLEEELKRLSERKLSRIYLPSGPFDLTVPNWLVELSAKTDDPAVLEQVPFPSLPQRLVVNAESEPRASNLVAKRYPDMRLRIRILGPWGEPPETAPATPVEPPRAEPSTRQ